MRTYDTFVIAFLSLVLVACALPELEPEAPSTRAPGALEIAAIKRKVSLIRNLTFTRDVATLFENRRGMAKRLEGEALARYGGSAKLANLTAAYVKLGLLHPSESLEKMLVETLADKTAGYYSLRRKWIVLAKPSGILYSNGIGGFGQVISESILAHELSHALQDQNFPLTERLLNARNGDEAIAFRAVTEGDAILTELAYGAADPAALTAENIRPAIGDLVATTEPYIASLPAVMADRVRFSYDSGAAFIYQVYRQHGWPGVNLLYQNPPLSTEQLLHPEKFFASDGPIEITLENLQSLFSTDWKLLENNVLGELLVRCLLRNHLPPAHAETAAAGWGGDRFAAFRRGEDTAFVWLTAWDTDADADEFHEAYGKLVSAKHAVAKTPPQRVFVERRQRSVMIVEGIDISQALPAIENVWREAKLVQSNFNHPLSVHNPG